MKKLSPKAKASANSMSEEQISHFTSTKTKSLPEKVAMRGDFAKQTLPWLNKTSPEAPVHKILSPLGRGTTGSRILAGDIRFNNTINKVPHYQDSIRPAAPKLANDISTLNPEMHQLLQKIFEGHKETGRGLHPDLLNRLARPKPSPVQPAPQAMNMTTYPKVAMLKEAYTKGFIKAAKEAGFEKEAFLPALIELAGAAIPGILGWEGAEAAGAGLATNAARWKTLANAAEAAGKPNPVPWYGRWGGLNNFAAKHYSQGRAGNYIGTPLGMGTQMFMQPGINAVADAFTPKPQVMNHPPQFDPNMPNTLNNKYMNKQEREYYFNKGFNKEAARGDIAAKALGAFVPSLERSLKPGSGASDLAQKLRFMRNTGEMQPHGIPGMNSKHNPLNIPSKAEESPFNENFNEDFNEDFGSNNPFGHTNFTHSDPAAEAWEAQKKQEESYQRVQANNAAEAEALRQKEEENRNMMMLGGAGLGMGGLGIYGLMHHNKQDPNQQNNMDPQNKQASFLNGFVKEAMNHGMKEDEIYTQLKEAAENIPGLVERLMGWGKKNVVDPVANLRTNFREYQGLNKSQQQWRNTKTNPIKTHGMNPVEHGGAGFGMYNEIPEHYHRDNANIELLKHELLKGVGIAGAGVGTAGLGAYGAYRGLTGGNEQPQQ